MMKRSTRREAFKLDESKDLIEIIDYDPSWMDSYLQERPALVKALGHSALEIHHVGSTSVPGLAAKPIVDIMVASPDLSNIDIFSVALMPLGYVFVPQEDPERLFFRKGMPRTHHLHIVKIHSWAYWRHLWFRDYLIDHASTAEEYECLKRVLASRFKADREAYTKGKEAWVEMVMGRVARERLYFVNASVD